MKNSEQHFEFEGKTYTKVYDPQGKSYHFLRNGNPIDVYEWNEVANRYHPMSHKATHPTPVVRWIEKHRWFLTRRHVTTNGSKFILDIGCESGNIASPMASDRYHLILMDVDRKMLSSIRSNAKNVLMTCLTGDIYTVPFKDGAIDRIICTEVLEHLTDPEKAIREIGRILKPGGRVVISVPNDRLILWIKQKLIQAGLKKVLGNLSPGLAIGHLRIFNRKSLSTLFGGELKIIRCFYNFPWFTNIFLVAEKKGKTS